MVGHFHIGLTFLQPDKILNVEQLGDKHIWYFEPVDLIHCDIKRKFIAVVLVDKYSDEGTPLYNLLFINCGRFSLTVSFRVITSLGLKNKIYYLSMYSTFLSTTYHIDIIIICRRNIASSWHDIYVKSTAPPILLLCTLRARSFFPPFPAVVLCCCVERRRGIFDEISQPHRDTLCRGIVAENAFENYSNWKQ